MKSPFAPAIIAFPLITILLFAIYATSCHQAAMTTKISIHGTPLRLCASTCNVVKIMATAPDTPGCLQLFDADHIEIGSTQAPYEALPIPAGNAASTVFMPAKKMKRGAIVAFSAVCERYAPIAAAALSADAIR